MRHFVAASAISVSALLSSTGEAGVTLVNVQFYTTAAGNNPSMTNQQGIVASTDATPYWNQYTSGVMYGWIPSPTVDLTNQTLYQTDNSAGLVDSGIKLSGTRAQSAAAGSGGIPLFRSGIYAAVGDGANGGVSITMTLTGLTVGQAYDLYVYGTSTIYNSNPLFTVTGSSTVAQSTTWNTGSTAYKTQVTNPGANNTAAFTGLLPASDGKLTIVASGSGYYGLNGLSLYSIPEPSAVLLGGLGLLGLLHRRRA